MRSACSVNVPNGPKNPTLAGAVGHGRSGSLAGGHGRAAGRGIDRAVWQHGAVDEPALRALLDDLARRPASTPTTSVRRLRRLPFADVGDALVDHHRTLRQGMPEAVYGPGKTPEQCVRIVGELLDHGTAPVLVTRASDDQVKAVVAEHGPALQQGRRAAVPRAGAAPRRSRARRDRRDGRPARSPTSAC